jgi:hypothetical protein
MSAATQPPRPAHPRIAVGIIPVRAPITTAQRRPRTTRQNRAFVAPNPPEYLCELVRPRSAEDCSTAIARAVGCEH